MVRIRCGTRVPGLRSTQPTSLKEVVRGAGVLSNSGSTHSGYGCYRREINVSDGSIDWRTEGMV